MMWALPSKRFEKFRDSFISRGTAWSPSIDYLPEDHWVRYRFNTIYTGRLIRNSLWYNPEPIHWFWNVYGINK